MIINALTAGCQSFGYAKPRPARWLEKITFERVHCARIRSSELCQKLFFERKIRILLGH